MTGMKIIRQGVLPLEEIYQGTCANCGCMIEGPLKDWIRVDAHNLQGGLHYKCSCPTKGCVNTIIGYKKNVSLRDIV